MTIVKIEASYPSNRIHRGNLRIRKFPGGGLKPIQRLLNAICEEFYKLTEPEQSTEIRVALWQNGWRELKEGKRAEFLAFVDRANKDFTSEAAVFSRDYWRHISESKTLLGDLFQEEDYPKNLPAKFWFKWEIKEVD